MKASAILPVKRFAIAKRRLGIGLDEERRRALILAMLGDVLAAIGEARLIERTYVVTDQEEAAELASGAGAAVLPDGVDSHSAAALNGVGTALEAGAACVALLPGDCPLLDPREVDRLLTGVPDRYVAVVPDRHGTGTNGLVLAPPDAIRPAFGEGSRARHVEAARAAEIPYSVEPLESLGLDLDTPADLVALTRALEGTRGRAPRTARALGI